MMKITTKKERIEETKSEKWTNEKAVWMRQNEKEVWWALSNQNYHQRLQSLPFAVSSSLHRNFVALEELRKL